MDPELSLLSPFPLTSLDPHGKKETCLDPSVIPAIMLSGYVQTAPGFTWREHSVTTLPADHGLQPKTTEKRLGGGHIFGPKGVDDRVDWPKSPESPRGRAQTKHS